MAFAFDDFFCLLPQNHREEHSGAPLDDRICNQGPNISRAAVASPVTSLPLLSHLPLFSGARTERSRRINRRRPKRYRDELPVAPTPVEEIPSRPTPILRRVLLHVQDFMWTAVNRFGVLREYRHRPSYDPDEHVLAEDLANFRTGDESPPVEINVPPSVKSAPPWPFENMTKFLLMNWVNSGSNLKTEAEITRLGQEVLSSPDFRVEELESFNARRENKRMDQAFSAVAPSAPFSGDGWHEVKVDIDVPVASRAKPSPASRTFSIPGLHFRPLVEVIKAAWGEDMSRKFHLSPFRRIHIHPETKVETRVFDEAYTSDVWIEAHNNLQKQPNELGCKLEKVISGLMFWSDSTHLANFGTAKVWPLYMYFANLSKYIRAQPNSGACHHVAYIPSVRSISSLSCSQLLMALSFS